MEHDKKSSKSPKGNGPGSGNHGVKGQVGNQCPAGSGTGNIGTVVTKNPLTLNIRSGKK